MIAFPLLACLLAEVLAAAPPAGEPLTTARAIAAHVTPAGEPPRPVDLEAVVTYQDPAGAICLRDGTHATFIFDPRLGNPRVSAGQRLRVVGQTHNGLFIGGIRPESITLLDQGPPPEPRPITPAIMEAGSLHYDWVWLEGVGRGIIPTGESTATLLLRCDDREVEVRFDVFPADESPPLVDARLRVTGLAAGETNDRRQMIRPYLRCRGIEDVTILDAAPADPFAEPVVSFAEVGRRRAAGRRVVIEGVVTSVDTARGLFLHDGERGMFVELGGTASGHRASEPGDRVLAVGFPTMGVFSAALDRAEVRVIGSEAVPEPVDLTTAPASRRIDAEPVVAEFDVLQRENVGGGTRLLGSSGPLAVRVVSPTALPEEFVPAPGRLRLLEQLLGYDHGVVSLLVIPSQKLADDVGRGVHGGDFIHHRRHLIELHGLVLKGAAPDGDHPVADLTEIHSLAQSYRLGFPIAARSALLADATPVADPACGSEARQRLAVKAAASAAALQDALAIARSASGCS